MRAPEPLQNSSRSWEFRGLGARAQRGVTFVETSLVLGIVGILSAAGLSLAQAPKLDLTAICRLQQSVTNSKRTSSHSRPSQRRGKRSQSSESSPSVPLGICGSVPFGPMWWGPILKRARWSLPNLSHPP